MQLKVNLRPFQLQTIIPWAESPHKKFSEVIDLCVIYACTCEVLHICKGNLVIRFNKKYNNFMYKLLLQ